MILAQRHCTLPARSARSRPQAEACKSTAARPAPLTSAGAALTRDGLPADPARLHLLEARHLEGVRRGGLQVLGLRDTGTDEHEDPYPLPRPMPSSALLSFPLGWGLPTSALSPPSPRGNPHLVPARAATRQWVPTTTPGAAAPLKIVSASPWRCASGMSARVCVHTRVHTHGHTHRHPCPEVEVWVRAHRCAPMLTCVYTRVRWCVPACCSVRASVCACNCTSVLLWVPASTRVLVCRSACVSTSECI